MTKVTPRAGLALCALMIGTATAHADAVTDWNEITMAAVTASRPGPHSMLDAALVHVAIHDAVQAIDKRYEPYQVSIRGAKGSPSAAVAAAAHDMLAGLYSEPHKIAALDATYNEYLARNHLTNDPGLEVGRKVAAGILPLRKDAIRTPVQPDLAHDHNDRSFAEWNGVLREVARKRLKDIGDTARLFALANTAQYTYEGQCRLASKRRDNGLFRVQFRCKQPVRPHGILQVKNQD